MLAQAFFLSGGIPFAQLVPNADSLPVTVQDQNIFGMILSSGPVVKLVLLILIALSIWSWAITIAKILQFRRARADSKAFTQLFWETKNLAKVDDAIAHFQGSPLAHVFSKGYRELTHLLHALRENRQTIVNVDRELAAVSRVIRRAELEETARLEKGITFLASVASAAPFIGLFGTVWGIMNAFHGLSFAKSTSIQAVAPGISEALIATAIGLAAAIPAAVAYNFFVVGVRRFRESMDRFADEFITVSGRYFNHN